MSYSTQQSENFLFQNIQQQQQLQSQQLNIFGEPKNKCFNSNIIQKSLILNQKEQHMIDQKLQQMQKICKFKPTIEGTQINIPKIDIIVSENFNSEFQQNRTEQHNNQIRSSCCENSNSNNSQFSDVNPNSQTSQASDITSLVKNFDFYKKIPISQNSNITQYNYQLLSQSQSQSQVLKTKQKKNKELRLQKNKIYNKKLSKIFNKEQFKQYEFQVKTEDDDENYISSNSNIIENNNIKLKSQQNQYQKSNNNIQFNQLSSANYLTKSQMNNPLIRKILDLPNLDQNNNNNFQNSEYDISNLFKQPKNMLKNIFIPSQKRENKGSILKNQSRFANKNKLVFSRIIKYMGQNNLKQFNLPPTLLQELQKFILLVKESGIVRNENQNIQKMNLYSHIHYALLFMTLNPDSVQQLLMINKKHKLHIEIHQNIFQINLKDVLIKQDQQFIQKIEYINFIKKMFYNLAQIYFSGYLSISNNSDQVFSNNFSQNEKQFLYGSHEMEINQQEYEFRVLEGIKKLAQGHYIHKF
ncbi:hypothetical protein PPERSA_08472 [Pseudocohnilembus persalinus]|uniref:Uncharacterized protein n=1 Tax=Pseudocohnilembus persalinus TaxID=266149 RepID=A0A0V0R775_PSEPJ|nr:hypothetical protein PPERSA_08472 [Pseudocohnilembus persalinus]|eukprot:KRX10069.1 hypothetical protein PPERSA_08472 [Pseudocohnilembus persalinus]